MDAFESTEVLCPEAELVTALAQGDRSAIRRVYRLHHEQVRAFASRLLGSEADAEEVVQEVFLALPRSLRGFKQASSLSTFIMGMAVNHARHSLRASYRRRAALNRLAQVPTETPTVEQPDQSLLRQQLARRLARAMDHLTEDQRITFVLSEVEERSSAEVAEILKIPSSTVRARVSAAREKLREVLAAEAGQ
jgi:RNA polymerase sigma-70 factor (ECF subfamily)